MGYQYRRPAWTIAYWDDCGPCEVSCLENRRVSTSMESESECELLSFSHDDKLLFILFTNGTGEEHFQNFHFWLQDREVTTRGSFLPFRTTKLGAGAGVNMKQSCLGNRKPALKSVIPERRETFKAIPLISLPLCLGEVSWPWYRSSSIMGEQSYWAEGTAKTTWLCGQGAGEQGAVPTGAPRTSAWRLLASLWLRVGCWGYRERLCKNYLRSGAMELRDQSLLRHTDAPGQPETRRHIRKVVP